MYLSSVIKSNIPLIKKINHFEFAISHKVKISDTIWKLALKKHPNFLTYNYNKSKSILYSKGSSFRTDKTNLLLELIFSRNSFLRNRKSTYDYNIKNLLKVKQIKNKEQRYLVEEVLFSRNIENILLVLDGIPNLNDYFKEKYQKVTSSVNSIKLFKYLKKRNFDFSQERLSDFVWLTNYLKTNLPLSSQLVADFFRSFSYSFKIEDCPYEDIFYCLSKVHEEVLQNNNLINEINIFDLDKIIVLKESIFKKDKLAINKIIDIRETIFKVGKERNIEHLNKIDKTFYYPHYMDKNNLDLIINNFDVSSFIKNKESIDSILGSIFQKEGDFTYFIPSKEFSQLMYYKKEFPNISEEELKEINVFEDSLFEKSKTMTELKKQYDERKVFSFYKEMSEDDTFSLTKKIDDLQRNINKYDREKMDILFPLNANSVKDLEKALDAYLNKRSRIYYNSFYSKVLNNKMVNGYTLKMGEANLFNKLILCGVDFDEGPFSDFSHQKAISFIYKDNDFKGILLMNETDENTLHIEELNEKIDISYDDIKGFFQNE